MTSGLLNGMRFKLISFNKTNDRSFASKFIMNIKNFSQMSLSCQVKLLVTIERFHAIHA